jgi:hypothetical protein
MRFVAPFVKTAASTPRPGSATKALRATARAGKRRFLTLSALRAHTKTP